MEYTFAHNDVEHDSAAQSVEHNFTDPFLAIPVISLAAILILFYAIKFIANQPKAAKVSKTDVKAKPKERSDE